MSGSKNAAAEKALERMQTTLKDWQAIREKAQGLDPKLDRACQDVSTAITRSRKTPDDKRAREEVAAASGKLEKLSDQLERVLADQEKVLREMRTAGKGWEEYVRKSS